MMLELTAVPLYTLPESFRHRVKPNPWQRMRRPVNKIINLVKGA